jgi:hypothetical protein
MDRLRDLRPFYGLLDALDATVGGKCRLTGYDGRSQEWA